MIDYNAHTNCIISSEFPDKFYGLVGYTHIGAQHGLRSLYKSNNSFVTYFNYIVFWASQRLSFSQCIDDEDKYTQWGNCIIM